VTYFLGQILNPRMTCFFRTDEVLVIWQLFSLQKILGFGTLAISLFFGN